MACTGQSAKLQGDMPECGQDVTLRLHLGAWLFTDQELLCYTCSKFPVTCRIHTACIKRRDSVSCRSLPCCCKNACRGSRVGCAAMDHCSHSSRSVKYGAAFSQSRAVAVVTGLLCLDAVVIVHVKAVRDDTVTLWSS